MAEEIYSNISLVSGDTAISALSSADPKSNIESYQYVEKAVC